MAHISQECRFQLIGLHGLVACLNQLSLSILESLNTLTDTHYAIGHARSGPFEEVETNLPPLRLHASVYPNHNALVLAHSKALRKELSHILTVILINQVMHLIQRQRTMYSGLTKSFQ